jgi:hypothetical protein
MNRDTEYFARTQAWITRFEAVLSRLEGQGEDPRTRMIRDATASQIESLKKDLRLAEAGVNRSGPPTDDSLPMLQPLPPIDADMQALSRQAGIAHLHNEITRLFRRISDTQGSLQTHRMYLADLRLSEPGNASGISEVESDIALQEELVRQWEVWRTALVEQLEILSG